jgi:3-hydroxy-9,10-secoandrosta-1,3,5(10)-triene-9,17-dione monooxygenase
MSGRTCQEGDPVTIAADAEGVTTEELLQRAHELRPLFSDSIEETEQLTHIPEALHAKVQEAGFYQLLVPKRYGGFEVDLPTYVKIWMEIARGDMSGAWNACLAANHALQLASWFPERTQDEIFSTPGGMKAASVAAPLSGFARKVDGGWELNGKVAYCSGIPYSTHYMGQALTEPAEPGGPPGPQILFWAPRDQFEVLDDWGKLTGLVGSGSNSIVFDKAFVPDHYVLEATHMADVDPGEGTIGYRLHGNTLYNSRGLGFFTMTVGGIMVGGAYGALDEFKHILQTRDLVRPPFGKRATDPDHQRWYGAALTKIKVAEGALLHSADMQMQFARNAVDGRPYTWGDDQFVGTVARDAYSLAWQAMQEWIFRYSGSSAATKGAKIERTLRDMATGWSHFNTANTDWSYGELGRWELGQPRTMLF